MTKTEAKLHNEMISEQNYDAGSAHTLVYFKLTQQHVI